MLVHFMLIWNMLWPFGIFYRKFVVVWYIFPHFGMLCQDKSGNPAANPISIQHSAEYLMMN
jgi:hypothetical protein